MAALSHVALGVVAGMVAVVLIAVFALAAGARDQIAKLDVLPGIIAVFMIGFSADTIKSRLSPPKGWMI
jgi:Flp pilus assembly pilin Flp